MKTKLPLMVSLFLLPAAGFAASFSVITWGENSPEWSQDLHVTGIRIGCSDAPPSCLKEVAHLAALPNVSQVYLATLLNPTRSAGDAETYGRESPANKALVEVGYDDFVSQSQKTKLDGISLSALIVDISQKLKAHNPILKLGVTLYEDQLANGQLQKLGLSDQARQSVDLVHLYPHYRHQTMSFADYVTQAQQFFPSAQVIAGSYAYDRREYLACTPGNAAHCSASDELQMFTETLQEQLRLAQSGTVVGIEFFPGSFGMEETWKGWQNPRFCAPGDHAQCVKNTQAMREVVKKLIFDAHL